MAYRVVKCKRPHLIAKVLILPAALDMVSIMVGESAGRLLTEMPLSNNIISSRIQHMAKDLNDELTDKMKEKEFWLQLDWVKDSNKDAHLIWYIRFVDGDKTVEDLLFFKDFLSLIANISVILR
ncbi:protein FAM200A-like [Tachypleus tridentatus]|uniref:protein FAM200A-like n=1 Tax=Tachypleus tridentatus TaxID=6853 RepID=UPI003FCFE7E7